MMKKLGINMDGVIADVSTHFIAWYERDYGIRVEKETLNGIPELEIIPNNAVKKMSFYPGFFRSVPTIAGSQDGVKELMRDFDIYIVSAAMEFPHSLSEKYEWLKEYFPFITWNNLVFCGDKSVIATDYLLDDHCKNLDTCLGTPLLFTARHNLEITHHQRLNNWIEVLAYFKGLAER